MAKERLSKDVIEMRKTLAKKLYLHDNITTQKELSARVGISERSISKWINDEKWDKLKKNFLLTREEQMSNLLDELAELNAFIRKKPEGVRFADSKEGDVRRKLIKDIKELEAKAALPEVIAVCKMLLELVRKVDLKDAQLLSKYCDALIKSLLR